MSGRSPPQAEERSRRGPNPASSSGDRSGRRTLKSRPPEELKSHPLEELQDAPEAPQEHRAAIPRVRRSPTASEQAVEEGNPPGRTVADLSRPFIPPGRSPGNRPSRQPDFPPPHRRPPPHQRYSNQPQSRPPQSQVHDSLIRDILFYEGGVDGLWQEIERFMSGAPPRSSLLLGMKGDDGRKHVTECHSERSKRLKDLKEQLNQLGDHPRFDKVNAIENILIHEGGFEGVRQELKRLKSGDEVKSSVLRAVMSHADRLQIVRSCFDRSSDELKRLRQQLQSLTNPAGTGQGSRDAGRDDEGSGSSGGDSSGRGASRAAGRGEQGARPGRARPWKF